MLQGMVGGVNVTLPHGAATVTAAVLRQLHVPVTGSATVLTSSAAGASPMHPATSATQPPTSTLRTLLLFILGLPLWRALHYKGLRGTTPRRFVTLPFLFL